MSTWKRDSIAITGIGIITPAGQGLECARQLWRDGHNFLQPITRFPSDGGRVTMGFPMGRFSLEKIPDRKAAKILNDKDLSAVVTMIDAVSDSQIDTGAIMPERFSLYCAAGNTQLSDLSPYFAPVKDCVDQKAGIFDSRVFGGRLLDMVNPLVVMRTLLNNSLCFGSRFLDARGTNSNYFDFETSGLRAIYEAAHALVEGRTDFSVVTAVSPLLEPFFLNELAENGICAQGQLANKSRPYDPESPGIIPGEAAVSFCLERLSDARARSARIFAVIDSVALGSEASFPAHAAGGASTLKDCLAEVIIDNRQSINDIGFIVGSGSGHVPSDQAEIDAISSAFKDCHHKPCLTSLKGISGECFESSVLLSIAAAIDMINLGDIYPMWGRSSAVDSYHDLRFPADPIRSSHSSAVVSAFSRFGMVGAMRISKHSAVN